MRSLYPLATSLGFLAVLSSCAIGADRMVVRPIEVVADAPRMPQGAPTPPPVGLIGFCLKYLVECAATPKPRGADTVALDDQHRGQLAFVQAAVNAAIMPRNVPDDVWDYPTEGYGECNQYALEKRRELLVLGWPREALLLTAAVTETGEPHLVLVARTTAGDLALDNRIDQVTDWTHLPYRWISQQTSTSLTQWVSLAPADREVALEPVADSNRQLF